MSYSCSFCRSLKTHGTPHLVAFNSDRNQLLFYSPFGMTACHACVDRIQYWDSAIQYGFSYNKPQPDYLDEVLEKYINHWPLSPAMKEELARAMTEIKPLCSSCKNDIFIDYERIGQAPVSFPHQPPFQCEKCALALNRLTTLE